MKSREVELGSHSLLVCLAAELFLNSCFSDTVTFCDRVFGPGCALGLFRDEAFKSFIICNLALQYSMYWIIVSGSSTLLVQLLLRPLHECEQLKSQHIKISHTRSMKCNTSCWLLVGEVFCYQDITYLATSSFILSDPSALYRTLNPDN